jgi:hypothetical protein
VESSTEGMGFSLQVPILLGKFLTYQQVLLTSSSTKSEVSSPTTPGEDSVTTPPRSEAPPKADPVLLALPSVSGRPTVAQALDEYLKYRAQLKIDTHHHSDNLSTSTYEVGNVR